MEVGAFQGGLSYYCLTRSNLWESPRQSRGFTCDNYDISPDGERFVMVQVPDSTERGQLEIVFNWFEEVERLVPTN